MSRQLQNTVRYEIWLQFSKIVRISPKYMFSVTSEWKCNVRSIDFAFCTGKTQSM